MKLRYITLGVAGLFALGAAASHAQEGQRLVAITYGRVVAALGYVPANPSLNTSGAPPAIASTSVPFSVVGVDGSAAGLPLYAYGNVARLYTYRSDGTAGAPTAVQSENLGSLNIGGYNGSAFKTAGQFVCASSEVWSATTDGSLCSITAVAQGSTTLATQMQFAGNYVTTLQPMYFLFPTRLSFNANVSAAGTSQAGATALTSDLNFVTTTPSGTGVAVMPYTTAGGALGVATGVQRQEITNVGANALSVYPPTGAAIWVLNGSTASLAANAPASLAVGSHGTFECATATQCYEAP